MDNGLIFPYRRSGAPDEAGDANRPKHLMIFLPSGREAWVWSAGPDPVVVKRWGDAGR